MKQALEGELPMGLDSKRQKMLVVCRNTSERVLEIFFSQSDEMDRKLCIGRGLCFLYRNIAGIQ